MSLYQLAPEILLYVFRLLSPAFFRQDARRLLVSRQWYQLARPVLLQDLDFSAESLRNFVLASNKVGMIRSIRNHVKTLSLALDGFENWHSAQFEPSSTELSGIDLQTMNTWTSELNDFLVALAGILQQCTRLQSLKLEARPEGHGPRAALPRRDYLMASPLASLVFISRLICLETDTGGTHLIQNNTSKMHLCTNINKMLPTLRRLRCRTSDICPRILDVPGNGALISLEDFVINLRLSEMSYSDTSYRYPIRCEHIPGDSFPQLKADVESHAREVVRMMKNPRIARIVSHTFPGVKMNSFNAITGRRMLLSSAAPWDADGDEIEERIVVQDLFDSDSSSEEYLL